MLGYVFVRVCVCMCAYASHPLGCQVAHPVLVCQIQLKEIFETDTDIALVLELVTGGELFDR